MNSSEHDELLILEARSTPLIRLLLAMAEEWGLIASDVEKLGWAVSQAAAQPGGLAGVRDLQAFDMLQQRAQGQATLLAKLTRKIADDQLFDRKRLSELIADIPFQSVRDGLQAAFDGTAAAKPGGADDEVDWF